MAEPIWTIGPSRPTDPPEPMQTAEARALTRATRGRMRPPCRDGLHDLRNSVTFGLAGKEVDQRADDQPAQGGYGQEANPTGPWNRQRLVSEEADRIEEQAKARRPQPRADPHQNRSTEGDG